MRIVTVHSDFIEFEPVTKALKTAAEAEKKKLRVEECLVAFSAVEKGDEGVAQKAAHSIEDVAKQVKCNRVVIYPWVHLTSNPAEPLVAEQEMKSMADLLAKDGYAVTSAPFGWYKTFNIKAKGHPLAELSREIRVGEGEKEKEVVSTALKSEDKMVSHWYVMEPTGKLVEHDKFDFTGHGNLKKFFNYELVKSRAVKEMPPHVTLMRKLELADYEPGSDPGNMRYYPKGRLVKSLLENFVLQKVSEYGGMEVETPIMYDINHPTLADYLHRFPARQYTLSSEDKKLFLRFAACFGQFLMLKDATISYKDLPVKLFELTRYSFRREKSGELVGLRRLRAFTMVDCHAICADLQQAFEEYKKRFAICRNVLKEIGFEDSDYEMAIRFTKEFYEQNKEFLTSLIASLGKPVMVEMWDQRFFYFVVKYELNFIDALDKASALSTDQIDVENAERYGITYVDRDGKKKQPIILHFSPSGAIERDIFALLEREAMRQKQGKAPMLPMWLSPTQVRLVPVSDAFVDYCTELAGKFASESIRADVDDRSESVSKRVRDAETEWVPRVLVVGDREKSAGTFQVRIRESGEQKNMRMDELIAGISSSVKGKPYKPLPLPMLLSKRPIFVG